MISRADRPERVLTPQPLTADAFAPFGDVIEVSARAEALPVNDETATRYHDLARVETGGTGGRAAISIFRAAPLEPPIRIGMMERHPLGSQAFIPLQQRPFLVVVAPPGELDPTAIRAFRAHGGQGVNYAPGVWHHFLLALEAESDFLVVDRVGEGDNLDVVRLGPSERAIVAL